MRPGGDLVGTGIRVATAFVICMGMYICVIVMRGKRVFWLGVHMVGGGANLIKGRTRPPSIILHMFLHPLARIFCTVQRGILGNQDVQCRCSVGKLMTSCLFCIWKAFMPAVVLP